jgi:hypothetical protein
VDSFPRPRHTAGAVAAKVGTHEAKQVLSSSRIVRWSHGSRFAHTCDIVKPLRGRSLLDHGCGEGTFVKKVRGGEFSRLAWTRGFASSQV